MKPKRMRWEGYVARTRGSGIYIEYWWEIQKERRLGLRCEDNIKMDIKGIEWGSMDWIDLV
jgi:hypothetical protein